VEGYAKEDSMSAKRIAWVPLVVAWAISVVYLFVFGVDWGFTLRSGTMLSAIFTGLILSVWASVPYIILLPVARRDGQLFTMFTALVLLAFGMFAMDRGRHTPGDEGGSYIVVPVQQMAIAALIVLGWRGVCRKAH
jgi:hypothetical protein